MVCIANHYNDDYKCAWPSVARLVDYCNVSKQAVHKALSQLEKSGELIIQYKAGPNGNNKYTFNLPGLDGKDKLTVEEHNYTNDSKPEFTESKHNDTTTVDSKPELTVNQSLPDSKLEFTETVNSSLPDPLITVNKPLSLPKGKGGKPPRTPKSKKSESSPTAPEAVMVYRSVTNRYPDKSTWAEIAGTVGGEPADLDFWREVVKAYIRCGWNKLNIDGMLKFYRDRRLPTTEKVSAQNGAAKLEIHSRFAGEIPEDNIVKRLSQPGAYRL